MGCAISNRRYRFLFALVLFCLYDFYVRNIKAHGVILKISLSANIQRVVNYYRFAEPQKNEQ